MDPSKALLIALNSKRTLSRDSICRLALHLDLWRDPRVQPTGLSKAIGVSATQLGRALSVRQTAAEVAKSELGRAQQLGFAISTTLDPDYPTALRDLELPPPVVYVEGRIPTRPGFSIVGSRSTDAYGLEVAELFSRVLSATGLTIVSGLARGIDGCAHANAIEGPGGRSIAVLACGLDRTYPPQHRKLRRRVAAQGAVISEFPLGAGPEARNFPIRNRLIAALGCGCLVVQATVRSGSQITARLALDLGRPVFGVPGGIFDRRARGTNALIRDGALMALQPTEILEALPLRVQEQLSEQGGGGEPAKDTEAADSNTEAADSDTEAADSDTAKLLRSLERGKGYPAEELARRAGIALPHVQALLVELEIDGRLRRQPGALYSKLTERPL